MRQIRISCKYEIIFIGGKYSSISESEGSIVVIDKWPKTQHNEKIQFATKVS